MVRSFSGLLLLLLVAKGEGESSRSFDDEANDRIGVDVGLQQGQEGVQKQFKKVSAHHSQQQR